MIYEGHLKGMTKRHPLVPPALHGTYAGLAHPAMIEHFLRSGVTSVELLPVHAFATEPRLLQHGLSNYWGYNTLNFFTPHAPYATEASRREGPEAILREFKGMVKLLHEAGLEVILDVVYNHTSEEGIGGPRTSLRGIDNRAYYRQQEDGAYIDVTGCGNSVNTVDGCRGPARAGFAAVLGERRADRRLPLRPGRDARPRRAHTLHPGASAAAGDHRRPRARGREEDRRAVGRGHGRLADRQLRRRLARVERPLPRPGAQLLAERRRLRAPRVRPRPSASAASRRASPARRTPSAPSADRSRASTSSPRMTASPCATSCRYDVKHNLGNGEHNRDGADTNRSFNHGAEGPTDDPGILATRRKAMRNLLGTLLLSAGIPMLTAGDEFARTQRGNNNAYCHDSAAHLAVVGARGLAEGPPRARAAAHPRCASENPALRPMPLRRTRSARPVGIGDGLVRRARRDDVDRALDESRRTARCSTSRHPPPRTRRSTASC